MKTLISFNPSPANISESLNAIAVMVLFDDELDAAKPITKSVWFSGPFK